MPQLRPTGPKVVDRQDLITTERAATIADVSTQAIMKALADGRLSGERIGSRYFVSRFAAEAYARQRAEDAARRLERAVRRLEQHAGSGAP